MRDLDVLKKPRAGGCKLPVEIKFFKSNLLPGLPEIGLSESEKFDLSRGLSMEATAKAHLFYTHLPLLPEVILQFQNIVLTSFETIVSFHRFNILYHFELRLYRFCKNSDGNPKGFFFVSTLMKVRCIISVGTVFDLEITYNDRRLKKSSV
jgi:hypothetical protein